MTHEITIPPQALEAAAIDLFKSMFPEYSWADMPDGARDMWRRRARAACLAMLKAWPKRGFRYERHGSHPVVVLPFEETSDD